MADLGAEIQSNPSLLREPPPAPPAAPAEPQTPAHLLGLIDDDLDSLKEPAKVVITPAALEKKRPKLTHGYFFDDDKGLKKVLRTFPKIKFSGKGREFDDLKLLVRNFEKWYGDLYPYDKNFEDSVWKMRTLLSEKQTNDEGVLSDPRERLHLLRWEYKHAPKEEPVIAGKGLSDEQKRRIEENRRRAMAKKLQKDGGAASSSSSMPPPDLSGLDSETANRVQANRLRALRLKEEKQAKAKAAAAGEADAFMAPPDMDDEDPFGFEPGLDAEPAMAPRTQQAAVSSNTMFEEEDDVFGFGAFDDEDDPMGAAPAAPAPRAAPAAQSSHTFAEEEDDVFGFGGGFDDSPGRPATAAGATATQLETATAAAARTQLECSTSSAGPGGCTLAPTARETSVGTATTVPGIPGFDTSCAQQQANTTALDLDFEEEDPFDLGGGLDDGPPPAAPAPHPTQLETVLETGGSSVAPSQGTKRPLETALDTDGTKAPSPPPKRASFDLDAEEEDDGFGF